MAVNLHCMEPAVYVHACLRSRFSACSALPSYPLRHAVNKRAIVGEPAQSPGAASLSFAENGAPKRGLQNAFAMPVASVLCD